LIQTLNASDELTDPAAVILKVISKRFAYPKGKTFAKFADEFAAITKKNANAVAAMAVAVDLEPDTLEMGVSPPTNESAKPKKKRKKLREGRTRAILEDSDVDECGHPI
ncbi:MAG: hypothetical protein KKC85_20135, partial [Gammaproteobacteria bacterium]|nr:hypothetical protein [Gammaproteobacteria bacterium]